MLQTYTHIKTHWENLPKGNEEFILHRLITKSSRATNLPRSTPDVSLRMYEWNDRCLIFCSFRYSSSHGSSGEQCTQQPFELCRQSFGSRLRSKRPSVFAKIWSTSSSLASDCGALFGAFDLADTNDGILLLAISGGWNASTFTYPKQNKISYSHSKCLHLQIVLLMVRPIVASCRSYRHVSECNQQLFLFGSMPTLWYSYVL